MYTKLFFLYMAGPHKKRRLAYQRRRKNNTWLDLVVDAVYIMSKNGIFRRVKITLSVRTYVRYSSLLTEKLKGMNIKMIRSRRNPRPLDPASSAVIFFALFSLNNFDVSGPVWPCLYRCYFLGRFFINSKQIERPKKTSQKKDNWRSGRRLEYDLALIM